MIVERFEKEDLKVINEGTLTVGLDTKISEELKLEGYARDLVRGIQNSRKESGLEITDRINLSVSGDGDLKAAFEQFKDFVSGETLSTSAQWVDSIEGGFTAETEEKTWTFKFEKV